MEFVQKHLMHNNKLKSTFKIKSGITVRLVSFYVRVVLKRVYSETRLLIQSLNLTAHEVRVLYLR